MLRPFQNMSNAQLEAKINECNNLRVPTLMVIRARLIQELTFRKQEEAARIARENEERLAREALMKAEQERKENELEELNILRATINSLLSELSMNKEQLSNLLESLTSLTSSIIESTITLATQQDEIKSLTRENNQFNAICSDLFVELDQLGRDIDYMRQHEEFSQAQQMMEESDIENSVGSSYDEKFKSETELNANNTDESQNALTSLPEYPEKDILAKLDAINKLLQQDLSNDGIIKGQFEQIQNTITVATEDAKNCIAELTKIHESLINANNLNQQKLSENEETLNRLRTEHNWYDSEINLLLKTKQMLIRANSLVEQRTALLNTYDLNNEYNEVVSDNSFDETIRIYNDLKESLNSENKIDAEKIEFDSVLLACKLLVAAAIKNNERAKSLFPEKILLADINTATTQLFENLLLSIPVTSAYYHGAQAQLTSLNQNKNKQQAIQAKENGKYYHLALNANDLKELKKDYILFDPISHDEIGRFSKSHGIIHFQGYGDNIALTISGELCDNQFVFDNQNADIKVTATFHNSDNLDIISHAKQFTLNGDIKSSGYINLETNADVRLGENTTIQAGQHLNISASSLNAHGRLHGNSCNVNVDKTLQFGNKSTVNIINDITLSSADLIVEGSLSTDHNLLINSQNTVNLQQHARINSTDTLLVKSKNFEAKDDSAINSNHIRLKVDEIVNIQNQAHIKAHDIGVRTKTINNNSPNLSFGSAYIDADHQFSNKENGMIKTEESFHVTGLDFENEGDVNFGKTAQVALRGSFINGHKQTAKISGQDGTILAHAFIQEGNLDANHLGIDVEQLHIKDNANLKIADQLSMSAVDSELSGTISSKDLVLKTDHVCELKGSIESTGNVILTMHQGNLGGFLNAQQCYIESEGPLRFNNEIYTQQLKVISEDTITLKGSIGLNEAKNTEEKPLIQLQSKEINIGQSATIDNPLGDVVIINQHDINNHGNIFAKNVLLKSDTAIHNEGEVLSEQCQMEAMQAINQRGQQLSADAYYRTGVLNLSGDIGLEKVGDKNPGKLVVDSSTIQIDAKSSIHAPDGTIVLNNKTQANLDGRIDANKLYLQTETANISGAITVNDEYIDAKNIQYHAKTEFANQFAISTDQLNMDAASTMTGKGTLSVAAHNANMSNVHANQINLNSDHLPITDVLLHRGSYANVIADSAISVSTQDAFTLNEPIHLAIDANIIVPSINIMAPIHNEKNLGLYAQIGDIRTSNQVSANGYVIVESAKDFYNDKAKINGNDGLFIHTNNAITNYGGTFSSPQYLQIVSGHGNILNQAHQYQIQGPVNFDMIQYVPGEFIGGNGAKNDGYGLFVQTPGKVINDASKFSAHGSIYVNADSGIDGMARTNRYQSYHKVWNHGIWGKKVTDEYSEQIQQPLFYSVSGTNDIISANGGINAKAVYFISLNGNYFSANGNIDWDGLTPQTICEKNGRALGGLIHDNKKTVDERNIPTTSVGKNTYLISLHDVRLLNALIVGPGNLYVKAKNVLFSAPILNHSVVRDQMGFDMSLPGLSTIPAYSLYQDLQALNNADNKRQGLANGWNLPLDSVNTFYNVMSALQTSPAALFNPTVSLNLTHTKTNMHYQTLADNVGVAMGGSMFIDAEDSVDFKNAVPVMVEHDAKIICNDFNQVGAELKSEMQSHSESISVGTNLSLKPTFGAKFSQCASAQTNYVNQVFKVGGNLETQVKHWNLKAANTIVNKWFGNVDHLSVVTPLNVSKSSFTSAEVNTGGYVGAYHASSDTKKLAEKSGIVAAENNNDTDPSLHIGHAELNSATMTAANQPIQADTIKTTTTRESDNTHAMGVMGNMNNLLGKGDELIPTIGVQVNDMFIKVPVMNKQGFEKAKNNIHNLFAPKKQMQHVAKRNTSPNKKKELSSKDEAFIDETNGVIDAAAQIANMPIELDTSERAIKEGLSARLAVNRNDETSQSETPVAAQAPSNSKMVPRSVPLDLPKPGENNQAANSSVSFSDQLKYIWDNKLKVTKEFFTLMANPQFVESKENDPIYTKAINLFYNSSVEANQELQKDYKNGDYGFVVVDLAKPFAEAYVGDKVLKFVLPLTKPGLNALSSTLGASPYATDALEFASGKVSQLTSDLTKGSFVPLLKRFGLNAAKDELEAGGKNLPRFKVGATNAKEANEPFIKKNMRPPYDEKIRPRTIQLKKDKVLFRVYNEDKYAAGQWLFRQKEIQGLTPLQIQDKFALPVTPTMITEVHLPAGTYLRVGRAAPQTNWGHGGAVQYQALDWLDEELFRNRQSLVQTLEHARRPKR